jgi:hypothetical protein
MDISENKQRLYLLSTEVFQVSLLVYLIILLVENFQKGIISDFLNLNWILGIVIISGIIMILFNKEGDGKLNDDKPVGKKGLILLIILALISASLIFVKIKDLGWLAWIVSILGGLIIFFISYFISNER